MLIAGTHLQISKGSEGKVTLILFFGVCFGFFFPPPEESNFKGLRRQIRFFTLKNTLNLILHSRRWKTDRSRDCHSLKQTCSNRAFLSIFNFLAQSVFSHILQPLLRTNRQSNDFTSPHQILQDRAPLPDCVSKLPRKLLNRLAMASAFQTGLCRKRFYEGYV